MHLPHAVGYQNGPPLWWSLPVLAVGGAICRRWRSRGSRATAGTSRPRVCRPGGPVDPERSCRECCSPALGDARVRAGARARGAADRARVGPRGASDSSGAPRRGPAGRCRSSRAAGSFAALSFVFASPLIAAVILIEATAIGGRGCRCVLLPGLLAAGIGSLVSLGMGSFTGLSTQRLRARSATAATFRAPDIGQLRVDDRAGDRGRRGRDRFMMRGGRAHVPRRGATAGALCLPIVGLIIAGLAIAFLRPRARASTRSCSPARTSFPGLLTHAGSWSLGALALADRVQGPGLHAVAGQLSAGARRSRRCSSARPRGIMASRLPGFPLTAAVAVGMGGGDRRGTAAAAGRRRARDAAQRPSWARGRAADHRRRRGRLRGDARYGTTFGIGLGVSVRLGTSIPVCPCARAELGRLTLASIGRGLWTSGGPTARAGAYRRLSRSNRQA